VFLLWVELGDEYVNEEPVENAYEDQAFDNFSSSSFHCNTDALAPPVIHTPSHVAHGPTSLSNGWVQSGCI